MMNPDQNGVTKADEAKAWEVWEKPMAPAMSPNWLAQLHYYIALAISKERKEWEPYAEHRAHCEIVIHDSQCTCGLVALREQIEAPVE